MEKKFEEERESTVPPDLPDEHDHEDVSGGEAAQADSLTEDILALFEDTKTYAEAEVRFQKSRAGYIGDRLKYVLAYGAAAFGVFHLALIAITVGLVLSLRPLIGPLLATIVVGGALLLLGLAMVKALRSKVADIRTTFDDGKPRESKDER